MQNSKHFRGEIYCTPCLKAEKHSRACTDLYVQDDGTYVAYCYSHKKELEEAGKKPTYDNLALTEKCFHIPWRDVVSLTLHKPDPTTYDRRGKVVTIVMKEFKNVNLMQCHAVEVLHALQLMADQGATIHQYGETGEGNHCWTETNYHWEHPAIGYIRDKYWGERQIANFQELCRTMCQIHEWELIDETMPLLDRIVKALDDSDAKDKETA
jgi:hypothetical protein